MALYIYRREPSSGARDLAEALDAHRYRAINRPIERKARAGDQIVCWGEALPNLAGVRILNGAAIRNKFTDAEVLRAAGVPTITVSGSRPTDTVAETTPPPIWAEVVDAASALAELNFGRTRPIRDGVTSLITKLSALNTELGRTLPPSATWLARTFNHVGGADLLSPPTVANYYSRKEEFAREYRIHSFLGKSIRAGIKAPRDGYGPTGIALHPWIRSWDGGWRIKYDGVSSKRRHRELAHAAVAALGLQFGAVDIGEKADGSLIVLECNRAPGVENGTVESYAAAIQRWADGEEAAGE